MIVNNWNSVSAETPTDMMRLTLSPTKDNGDACLDQTSEERGLNRHKCEHVLKYS